MRHVLSGLVIAMAGISAASASEVEGRAVFERWCVHCHGTQASAPGRLKLGWTRGVDRSILADRDDLTAQYIRAVVRGGQAEMPTFRKTEISDADLDSLIAFLTLKR